MKNTNPLIDKNLTQIMTHTNITQAESLQVQENVQRIIDNFGRRNQFDIFSPGGNDTCLVRGIIEDPQLRKEINNSIMKLYGNVEQVGFIDLESSVPRLEMAGGEFCGNATRSFAYKYFGGNPGEGEFKISGVNRLLKAGINDKNEVWAEMPIFKDIEKITPFSNGNYLVEMEGICHYICYMNEEKPNSGEVNYQENIKKDSMEKILELGLDKYPAAGIMYVYRSGDSVSMEPVVYVKSINSLFYETACGSGTTALGMAESVKNKSSINSLSVTQPSGELIKISVTYNPETNSFENATILGKVKKLISGDINVNSETEYKVERCDSPELLKESLENGLTKLYQDCFGAEPYNELFTDEEVRSIFEEYLQRGGIYLSKVKSEIIGFSSFVDLNGETSVMNIVSDYVKENNWDINKCKYVADLGINGDYRRKNIGRIMVLECMNNLQPGEILIMRTSEKNMPSWNLFQSLGFVEMKGITQDTASTRLDGNITTDKRIFSYFIKK